MNEHRRGKAITLTCRVLRVAVFYTWLHEPLSDHAREDARLLEFTAPPTAQAMAFTAPVASPLICEKPESCGLHRVERIMREDGIKPVRGYKKPDP